MVKIYYIDKMKNLKQREKEIIEMFEELKRAANENTEQEDLKMSNDNLSFEEFLKKYSHKRSDEVIAYELYLILQHLKIISGMINDE